MESLFTLAPHLDDERFLLLTVDAVFAPAVLRDFLAGDGAPRRRRRRARRHRLRRRREAAVGRARRRRPHHRARRARRPAAPGHRRLLRVPSARLRRDRGRPPRRLHGAAPVPRATCSRAAIGVAGAPMGKTIDVDRPAGHRRRRGVRAQRVRRRDSTSSASRASASTRPARSRTTAPSSTPSPRGCARQSSRRRRQRRRAAARGRTAARSSSPCARVRRALATLRRWEAAGVRVINSVAGIANAIGAACSPPSRAIGVPHPESVVLAHRRRRRAARRGSTPAPGSSAATCTRPSPTTSCASPTAARRAPRSPRSRGAASPPRCLQRHVAGDVRQVLRRARRASSRAFRRRAACAIDRDAETRMRALAEAGAAALELEVFGGDCVRDVNGSLWLIDLNDWPSYARCRFEAAEAIAVLRRQHSEESREDRTPCGASARLPPSPGRARAPLYAAEQRVHRPRSAAHRAALRADASRAARGCDAHRRRRQQVPRLLRRRRGREPRPLAPALRHGAAGAARAARRSAASPPSRASTLLKLLAKLAPGDARRTQLYSGGAEAVEAAHPPRQVVHQEVRGRRLLGRLPRQDRRRHGPDRRRVEAAAGARCRAARISVPYADCYRCPFKLTLSRLRHRLRRLRARAAQGRRPPARSPRSSSSRCRAPPATSSRRPSSCPASQASPASTTRC